MFGTVGTFIALVVFVLPGFITARVTSGRRPTPATLGDLELVLRALGYSLVLHTVLALTTWTPTLIREIDDGNWTNHIGALALFALVVLISAWMLGMFLGWALDRLQTHADKRSAKGRALALATFHALGGQDVRDGFDYVFARRKRDDRDFIAVVHTTGDGGDRVHAGRYGDASYFGLSPRPHDLYLEEMWEMPGQDKLEIMKPKQGAWFAAESIRDVYFRDLPENDKESGVTTRVGIAGIEEAIRQERQRIAADIAAAIPALLDDPDDYSAASAALRTALDTVLASYRDAPRQDDTPVSDSYAYWTSVTPQLVELGAAATALAAEGAFHRTARHIASEAAMGNLRLRLPSFPWQRWTAVLEQEAHAMQGQPGTTDPWAFQVLIGLIVEEISTINNAEWDFPDY